jgi:hypothetical protein
MVGFFRIHPLFSLIPRLNHQNLQIRHNISQMSYDYDLIVIGGGSGGMASAKEAATLGAKVSRLIVSSIVFLQSILLRVRFSSLPDLIFRNIPLGCTFRLRKAIKPRNHLGSRRNLCKCWLCSKEINSFYITSWSIDP